MSWHINNIGTKEEVNAAIDEAVGQQHGMPAKVGAYLQDVVSTIDLKPGFLVHVESNGHRPMSGAGSSETTKVELIRSGPATVTR